MKRLTQIFQALLAGSVVLFLLLCVVMYLTANMNNNKELAKTE